LQWGQAVSADPAQLISKDIKFDPNATPWQWTDNEDQVIEKGAQVRVKLLGIRSDVGAMYAIGSIKEDYLGFVDSYAMLLLIMANMN
jgi:DNA-directed RNA polymerase II subunit RPB7